MDKYDHEQLKKVLYCFESNYELPSTLSNDKSQMTNDSCHNMYDISGNAENKDEENKNSADYLREADYIADQPTGELKSPYSEKIFHNVFPYEVSPSISTNQNSRNTDRIKEDSEYLIFERHFGPQIFSRNSMNEGEESNDSDNRDTVGGKFPNTEEELDPESLGIIDLEDEDLFDDIDDDKLPVLKKTYSKKNRPNNSRSVAAGSKSKANRIDYGIDETISGPNMNKTASTPEKPAKTDTILRKNIVLEKFDWSEPVKSKPDYTSTENKEEHKSNNKNDEELEENDDENEEDENIDDYLDNIEEDEGEDDPFEQFELNQKQNQID
jgi:hypothetical protein